MLFARGRFILMDGPAQVAALHDQIRVGTFEHRQVLSSKHQLLANGWTLERCRPFRTILRFLEMCLRRCALIRLGRRVESSVGSDGAALPGRTEHRIFVKNTEKPGVERKPSTFKRCCTIKSIEKSPDVEYNHSSNKPWLDSLFLA